MFNRKVWVMALLAVVLLGSFMGGGVELIKKCHRCKRTVEISLRHRIKPRDKTASILSGSAPAALQASRGDNKPRSPRKPRMALNFGGSTQISAGAAGLDLTNTQATAVDQKSRNGGHKRRTADLAGSMKLAGYAKTLDPAGRIRG